MNTCRKEIIENFIEKKVLEASHSALGIAVVPCYLIGVFVFRGFLNASIPEILKSCNVFACVLLVVINHKKTDSRQLFN